MATSTVKVISKHLNGTEYEAVRCDFTVIIGDRHYPCHRSVLGAVSEYFRLSCTISLRESVMSEAEFEDRDADTFELILTYAYSQKLEINLKNAFELLKAGDYFQMDKKFVKLCTDFVARNPNVENPLEIILFADHPMNDNSFIYGIARRMGLNLKSIIKNPVFANIQSTTLLLLLAAVMGAYRRQLKCDHVRAKVNHRLSCVYLHLEFARLRYHIYDLPDHCKRCCKRLKPYVCVEMIDHWIKHDTLKRMGYFNGMMFFIGAPDIGESVLKSLLCCQLAPRKWWHYGF